jgi:teichuronic acid biosynthesis glycosyltransferase TuaC
MLIRKCNLSSALSAVQSERRNLEKFGWPALVILVFTNLFPNVEDPNYGIFVYRRARQLCDGFGHSVHVVAPVPYFPKWLPIPARLRALPCVRRWLQASRIPHQERCNHINVYHPRYFMLPRISAPLHGLLMFLGAILLVLKLHARIRFDCVDAHFVYPDGFAAVLIAKLLRLPVMVTAHGSDLTNYPQFLILRPLIRWTLHHADRVICVCLALQRVALQLAVPNDKVLVIPNGVDLGSFRGVNKVDARRTLGILPHADVVLSVAQLNPKKGHMVLIRAVPHLRRKFPKLQLFIVGEGDLGQTLQREVSALGLERHVFLQGAVRNEELFRWYSAADVTCLTSSREGLSCVLLESLACGTPVVATAVGGTPELINSRGLGVLVQQDVFSISRGLEQALQSTWNPDVLTGHVRHYTWEQSAVSIQEVLTALVKREMKTASAVELVTSESNIECPGDLPLKSGNLPWTGLVRRFTDHSKPNSMA